VSAKQEVTVEVNQSVTVDFSMKVGAANQVVDVEAGASELQTQDAVTGQVVDRRLINNLPLINRDFPQPLLPCPRRNRSRYAMSGMPGQ